MKIVTNSKYLVQTSTKFKKQLNKIVRQGKEINKLIYVVKKLANEEELEQNYKNHNLRDNKKLKHCMELHIEPDWLLIYQINSNKMILLLIETGSHSELF